MKTTATLLATAAALLAGCALPPITIADIEGARGSQTQFTVPDAAPAVVQQRLVQRGRACISGGVNMVVDPLPAGPGARVSVVDALEQTRTYSTAVLTPAGSGTQVRVAWYDPNRTGKMHRFVEGFESWARGQDGRCEAADTWKPRND